MGKKSKPKISVIIPFRNDSVIKILTSLSNCDEKDKCEIILISDGNKHIDFDFLGSHITSLDIKIVVTEKCGKIGHLRNLGIERANSDFLYFVDSDCLLRKDTLAKVIATKDECNILKGRNIFIGRNWISRLDAQLRDERYTSNPNFAYCPNLMVHANVLQELGFFNSHYTYGSDGEFAKRISTKGIEVKYNREIVIYHDCTDSLAGVFKKWMNYGEARYYRYQNENVKNKLSTYFPNLFNLKRGVLYNCVALLCDIGRAIGMLRALSTRKSL